MSPALTPLERLIPVLKRWAGGSVRVKARNSEIVQIHAAPHDLVIDLRHIELVKNVLESFRSLGVHHLVGEVGHASSLVHQLTVLKGFAEALNDAKLTLRIRRQGETMLVLGEQAKPRLSRVVLGNNIQANILQITTLLRDIAS